MASPDGQHPVIGHSHIISCIPPHIINSNSMVLAHVILVTALVQKLDLGVWKQTLSSVIKYKLLPFSDS